MATTLQPGRDAAARAEGWRVGTLSAVCDVIEPWAHGRIFRATRYPSYYDLNVVRVEEPVAIGTDELIAVSEQALTGLDHRLIEFAHADEGEAVRAEFERRGWRSLCLVWMRQSMLLPPDDSGAEIQVTELPFDAVHALRVRWHEEDFSGRDPAAFHREQREVALRRDARVFAAVEDGAAVAFAQLERHGRGAEISEVYVRRDRRRRGIATAVTRAAAAAAREARDLWISADEYGEAKRLYHRLGFRPAARWTQFLRLPD